ncbi:MAG: DnaJ domain-containing protein [Clostridium neonatale]
MDPYQILGIDSNASEEEIQARYQALIEEYTKNQDETTQEKIKL